MKYRSSYMLRCNYVEMIYTWTRAFDDDRCTLSLRYSGYVLTILGQHSIVVESTPSDIFALRYRRVSSLRLFTSSLIWRRAMFHE